MARSGHPFQGGGSVQNGQTVTSLGGRSPGRRGIRRSRRAPAGGRFVNRLSKSRGTLPDVRPKPRIRISLEKRRGQEGRLEPQRLCRVIRRLQDALRDPSRGGARISEKTAAAVRWQFYASGTRLKAVGERL